MNYFRIHTIYDSISTGKPAGIFAVMHRLRREGRLSEEEVRLFEEINAWYKENLPEPAFYKDGNPQKAICWFKDTPEVNRLLEHLSPLIDVLNKHGVENTVTRTAKPGQVVYEDGFQVPTL
jgi:hypothetical protein